MDTINSRLSDSSFILPVKKKQPQPEFRFQHDDIFIWADDLAIRFSTVYGPESKTMLKLILECLINESSKWGLKINFRKSALQMFHTRRENFSELSDSRTDWDSQKK